MNIIEEAKAYTEGWFTDPAEGEPWKPFDQAARIPDWNEPNWRTLPARRKKSYLDGVEKWEEVHGHDVRLKCYPEFNYQVIESYGMYLIQRLTQELEAIAERTDSQP